MVRRPDTHCVFRSGIRILPPGYPTFAAGDAVALSRQLVVVLAWDQAARETLKQQVREWVRGRHDWDRIANRYEKLYRRAVAG